MNALMCLPPVTVVGYTVRCVAPHFGAAKAFIQQQLGVAAPQDDRPYCKGQHGKSTVETTR